MREYRKRGETKVKRIPYIQKSELYNESKREKRLRENKKEIVKLCTLRHRKCREKKLNKRQNETDYKQKYRVKIQKKNKTKKKQH